VLYPRGQSFSLLEFYLLLILDVRNNLDVSLFREGQMKVVVLIWNSVRTKINGPADKEVRGTLLYGSFSRLVYFCLPCVSSNEQYGLHNS
jgi:hypothetical protein